MCGIHFHFTETEQKPFSKNTLRKCKVHINIHHKNKVGGPSNIVAGMPKKLKARVFWSPPNSSWSSYFLKEIWKGKKVASFSFNTWSSNSTECSYSSGLLWINDRIPQRTDPKGFFLSNGVYLQVHEKEKSSHGSCAGKGITATARRKVGSKAGVLWILQKKKKERKKWNTSFASQGITQATPFSIHLHRLWTASLFAYNSSFSAIMDTWE